MTHCCEFALQFYQQIGANVISSKDKNKESLVASNQETGGSVLELRREADQFRRQQSLAQPPMSHQPEPISPGGRVGQGSSRSLHMSAPIGQTGGNQHQTGETKRISAVLLQRASSVAVRGTEENAQENEQARTGTGTQGSDQPEWLQLAQKKREKRELQEKMDNTSMGVSNAAKVQDSASNNRLSSSNNFVNSQEVGISNYPNVMLASRVPKRTPLACRNTLINKLPSYEFIRVPSQFRTAWTGCFL